MNCLCSKSFPPKLRSLERHNIYYLGGHDCILGEVSGTVFKNQLFMLYDMAWKQPKTTMGDIFEIAELFIPDLKLFFWKSTRFNEIWIFLPSWQNMLLEWHVLHVKIWQYGLWSFQTGGTKLERFLPKNQHTQRKLLNFENSMLIFRQKPF